MKNGEIIGNTANRGAGGMDVAENGTFTMKGGTISGNTANDCGGGVGISGENAICTMKGGTISGNTSNDVGGGVSVWQGTFIMEDGAISDNTAKNDGGGVQVWENATFTMKGGAISDNTATNSHAGGVSVWQGTFTMEDGEISGNTADNGGGVKLLNNGNVTFTKKGGIIYGDTDTTHSPGSTENTALSGNGHAVWLDSGKKYNADADSGRNLYAHYDGSTWSYNDTSGGAGDTTSNWEE
jgi:hypothetical protein